MAAEEEEHFPAKKKLHVNAASLVDLKATLYRTQQQVKRGSDGYTVKQNKKTSDKTASIWRREPKKGQRQVSTTKGHQSTTNKKSTKTSSQLTPEEEATLAKSKASLEAKAKLYDKLMSGGGLEDENEEGEDDDEGPRYMVDFQRKAIELNRRNRSTVPPPPSLSDTVEKKEDEKVQNSDEEWVEYVDSLGRSRRCLRKDLKEMKRQDQEMAMTREHRNMSRSPTPELLSSDMRRERERQRWERESYNEVTGEEGGGEEGSITADNTGPVHYQNIQYNEVRSHGVGYYQFSEEEERRQEQFQTLNKLRDQTVDQRAKREQLKAKRQALLEAKLARVKARRLQEGGEGGGESKTSTINIADFNFEEKPTDKEQTEVTSVSFEKSLAEQVALAREKAEEEERAKHVRPWDKGKVTVGNRKRKDRIQELREERPSEFAPPSSYKKTNETHNYYQTVPPPPPPPPPHPPVLQETTPTTNDSDNHPPLFPYPPPPPPPPPPVGIMYYPVYYPTMYPPPPPPPPPSSS